MCGQMRRAAIRIAGNITEGFGRKHSKDKMNVYYYSLRSTYEE
ncbi:MAG: four helix bundle protein [Bacteroidetes bacterium]|nr:four helix bundle protein [Bacteroidota bacterium]MBS1931531.1 four helix bundle protein [Bacteroidota bacterium]